MKIGQSKVADSKIDLQPFFQNINSTCVIFSDAIELVTICRLLVNRPTIEPIRQEFYEEIEVLLNSELIPRVRAVAQFAQKSWDMRSSIRPFNDISASSHELDRIANSFGHEIRDKIIFPHGILRPDAKIGYPLEHSLMIARIVCLWITYESELNRLDSLPQKDEEFEAQRERILANFPLHRYIKDGIDFTQRKTYISQNLDSAFSLSSNHIGEEREYLIEIILRTLFPVLEGIVPRFSVRAETQEGIEIKGGEDDRPDGLYPDEKLFIWGGARFDKLTPIMIKFLKFAKSRYDSGNPWFSVQDVKISGKITLGSGLKHAIFKQRSSIRDDGLNSAVDAIERRSDMRFEYRLISPGKLKDLKPIM